MTKVTKAARAYLTAIGRKGASKGGKARIAKLSKAERSALARKAAKARWAKPRGGFLLDCSCTTRYRAAK